MRKFYFNFMALIALLCVSFGAKATGWPANYQGVMLQGFYWDSYNETSWAKLTSQSDELSKYFKLIWVPNSAQSSGMPTMGYLPIYWFTNHNSSFGTEAQLRNMIKTFKEKGVGLIEDVVVNHRVGVKNWADFPKETWNGQTWQLDATSVCSTDEWGQGKGAPDTGDDFNGGRDLDHTNANVQNNVKNYCKFLIDDLGYVGFRLDMVKGYGGQYTKIYNQYSKPQFCVGEYFDGSYDACAAWIEATGRESAAFDFPFKFAVNDAFGSNDMRKLCWKAMGTTDQPAGLIHYGYSQYAVTFIDNHDTDRDHNKFNGNVVAANAFMLCSPGTPCVFWKHYTANKTAIQNLIAIRNAVGIHNNSKVNVLRLTQDCYMAEVIGTNGKLVVKIGPAMVSPDGYKDSDIKASGTNYCVWTTTDGGFTPTPTPTGPFTVYFKNTKGWTTPHIHYWGGSESTWPGVAMTKVEGDVWSYTVPAGTTGILFNAGDGDATKTADMAAYENHLYTPEGDQGEYSGATPTPKPDPNPDGPFNVYFHNTKSWTTPHIHYWGNTESTWPGVAMTKVEGDIWSYTVPAGTTGILFNAGDGDATKTADMAAYKDHLYNPSGDQGVYDGTTPTPTPTPDGPFDVYFQNTVSWTTPHIHYWGNTESTWPGVAMSQVEGDIWSYTVPAGTTGILFNAGDGDPTKTVDMVAYKNHLYTIEGDQGEYSGSKEDPTPTPDPTPGTLPESLFLVGHVNGYEWATDKGVEAANNNGVYTWNEVEVNDCGDESGYFAFVTILGADWDTVNSWDRYGATTADELISDGQTATIVLYPVNVSASGALSWKIAPGVYNMTADLNTMKLTVNKSAGINDFQFDEDGETVYFNLQGIRVLQPGPGIYIVKKGNKTSKVLVR